MTERTARTKARATAGATAGGTAKANAKATTGVLHCVQDDGVLGWEEDGVGLG